MASPNSNGLLIFEINTAIRAKAVDTASAFDKTLIKLSLIDSIQHEKNHNGHSNKLDRFFLKLAVEHWEHQMTLNPGSMGSLTLIDIY